MGDPYAALEPDVAEALRDVIHHEFNRAFEPLIDAESDRQLAQTVRDLSVKYKDFAPNQIAALQFAVDRGIPDVEAAFLAMRAMSTAESQPEPVGAPGAGDAENAVREKRRARLEELRFKDDIPSQMERAKLENEEEADREAQSARIFRKDADPVQLRRAVIEEANAEADVENRLHSARVEFGRGDTRRSGRAKTNTERYAEKDLEAIELIRAANEGREHTPKSSASRAPSRAEVDADLHGHDQADRLVREIIAAPK